VFGTVAPRFGAHAEYLCLPEGGAVAPMPATVSFAAAAALADVTALCLLRDRAGLRPGQAVLVNGAAGAVGVAAVQLAGHLGAVVTGVCSGPHVRLVRKKSELVAVIGGRYPLERIAEAHARVDAGDVKGTIVVTMA
jgi:NADPH:quinone reductase-like Zn-dependent oxidoreductase